MRIRRYIAFQHVGTTSASTCLKQGVNYTLPTPQPCALTWQETTWNDPFVRVPVLSKVTTDTWGRRGAGVEGAWQEVGPEGGQSQAVEGGLGQWTDSKGMEMFWVDQPEVVHRHFKQADMSRDQTTEDLP